CARGAALSENLPEIDKTIVVAKTDAVPTIRTAYSAAVAAGTWLPFVVLALFLGAILLSRRPRRPLAAAAAPRCRRRHFVLPRPGACGRWARARADFPLQPRPPRPDPGWRR